jgi:uncharacterized protein
MQYGLKDETIEKIRGIFANYEEIDEAILYGSRAKGNYRNGSDIDITLKGEKVNLKLLNKISLNIDDLYLPYTFDLSIYRYIKNSDLLNHIERVKKVFYKK